jgi:alkanesulfonate monooxygenase SsuD/methylene tetrahydromethanopterin reductase-like flavin-dependent oxidoreductase (luciferase family)
MKLGLFNLMTRLDASTSTQSIIADTGSMVQLADDIGFDIAWFAEHHFSNYSVCPSPLMMAAFCAGRTRRIRLGPAVLVLPLYNPLRMIEEIGLLDVQSEGRAVIGIGSGYQKYEFDRFNQKLSEKTAVFMEIWDILEMALRNEEIAYKGRYFDVPRSPLAIRPLGGRQPEIYVTGLEPAVIQRTARAGHTSFITAGWKGFPVALDMRNHVVAEFAAAGVPSDKIPLGVQQYVFVTDDRAEALDIGERARSVGRIVTQMRAGDPILEGPFIKAPPIPDEPPLETFRDNLVIGDPHLCAEKLVAEIRALGTTHLSVFMQIGSVPGARARRSLERFARDVVPLIERDLGPLDAINAISA